MVLRMLDDQNTLLNSLNLKRRDIPCFLYVTETKKSTKVGMITNKKGDSKVIKTFCNQMKSHEKYKKHTNWKLNKRYYEIVFTK